jgi:hypothetical protein
MMVRAPVLPGRAMSRRRRMPCGIGASHVQQTESHECFHAARQGHPAPNHRLRMPRQVSWLSGRRLAPAFPEKLQWQGWRKTRRSQLRGQPRIPNETERIALHRIPFFRASPRKGLGDRDASGAPIIPGTPTAGLYPVPGETVKCDPLRVVSGARAHTRYGVAIAISRSTAKRRCTDAAIVNSYSSSCDVQLDRWMPEAKYEFHHHET